jgi:hypothetical protein
MNRPVRTRMPGWCGGWGRKTPGYPIICFSFNCAHCSNEAIIIIRAQIPIFFNQVILAEVITAFFLKP